MTDKIRKHIFPSMLLFLLFMQMGAVFCHATEANSADFAESVTVSAGDSAAKAVESAADGATVRWKDCEITEDLRVCGKRLVFSGCAKAINGKIILEKGASVVFRDFDLTLTEDAEIKVKDAQLTVESGRISAQKTAVRMNYAPTGEIKMSGGSISTSEATPAMDVETGILRISGGEIKSNGSSAVRTVPGAIFSGTPSLVGTFCGIETSSPLLLSDGNLPFLGSLSVQMQKTFRKGSVSPIAYRFQGESGAVTLSDSDGNFFELQKGGLFAEEDELCVNLAHKVKFSSDGKTVWETEVLNGGSLLLPEDATPLGFSSEGWTCNGEPFTDVTPIYGDVTVTEMLRLLPPTAEAISEEFTFDGEIHTVSLSRLSHPLLEKGEVLFQWFKNGCLTEETNSFLSLSSVCDSGDYQCKVFFLYRGYCSETVTSVFSVTVHPLRVPIPSFPDSEYTGFAQPIGNTLARVRLDKDVTPTEVGVYPLTFSLSDAVNTVWEDGSAETVTVLFRILPACVTFPTPTEPTYNGTWQRGIFPASPLYSVLQNEGGIHAGVYSAVLRLTHPENSAWEDGSNCDVNISYHINPLPLVFQASDIIRYLDGESGDPDFTLLSDLPEGVNFPTLIPVVGNGCVDGYCPDSDFSVTVLSGSYSVRNRYSPQKAERILCFSLLAFLLFAVLCALLVSRKRIRRFLSAKQKRKVTSLPSECSFPSFDVTPTVSCSPLSETVSDSPLTSPFYEEHFPVSDGISAEEADSLITDELAEALVSLEKRVIHSSGTEKGVVNVDTLSETFSAGSVIDINCMKREKLLSEDVGSVKILARGILDKPLTVVADDFSLRAVKMIALTGGEAVRSVPSESKTEKN